MIEGGPSSAEVDLGFSGVRTTHISVVALLGDRAYKFPKPVRFAFVDQSTVERRLETCRQEVDLNRRLAADVYLGVGDLGVGGETAEHCVVMRRMPDDRRLTTIVAGGDGRDEVRQVARRMARFHAEAERSDAISRAADPDALRRLWEDNLAELGTQAAADDSRAALGHIAAMARRYLAGREPLLRNRQREGNICDGHGDLLADDIFCLDDGPRILDCLAFADDLRHGDVLLDMAFLAMDLERLGAPDLADRLLEDYTEFSDEHHPATLARHYIAYRALVRAKVAWLRDPTSGSVGDQEARRLVAQCERNLDRSRVHLIVLGGPPASGKSTLAHWLTECRGWTVLSSDEVRKELAGREWTERGNDGFEQGMYTRDATAEVYRTLLERARQLLERGESVVLDASWARTADRADARALAHETTSDLTELLCSCSTEETERRIRQRVADDTDVSDADDDVARRLAARFDAWPGAFVVDTEAVPTRAVAVALAHVERRVGSPAR